MPSDLTNALTADDLPMLKREIADERGHSQTPHRSDRISPSVGFDPYPQLSFNPHISITTMDTVEDVTVCPDDTAAAIREYLRTHPELRPDEYDRGQTNTVDGLCYVAAEAYFHAKGGSDSGLDIYCLSWGDVYDDASGTHWFLGDGDTVVDLGLPAPEDGDDVPFTDARRRAFITGYEPSKRTSDVLAALGIGH